MDISFYVGYAWSLHHHLIVERLSVVDRISVPTVEKGSDFFACTLVFHNGYGNQQALFSV